MPSTSSGDFRLTAYPHVCIVDASAGTGKTTTLASRYIQLMMDQFAGSSPYPFKNILAITFSNKATVEMKKRILDILKRIALDGFRDASQKEHLLALLGLTEEEARRRAFVLMDGLIRSYNFFQVQTIDSFVNAILAGCAFKIGLSANFRIRTDSSVYLGKALDELLDKASSDKATARLFGDLLEQYLYLERKSGWFPKEDIFDIISKLFATVNRLGQVFVRLPVEGRDVGVMKKQILKEIGMLAKDFPEATHKGFVKSVSNFLGETSDFFDFDDLSDFFKREEFPMTKSLVPPEKVARLWKNIRVALGQAAMLESTVFFNSYVDVFSRTLGIFRELAGQDDVLFLDELNNRARLLFDEGAVTVPELYYRLAMGLKHFLVDEFQDTSRLQWRNLDPMVEEALSVGGSLFYVGDKKQAIYRFRGGDVTLFDALKDRFKQFPVIGFPLTRNYRSRREIVLFCNKIFSQDNLRRFVENTSPVDTQAVLDVYRGAEQEVLPGRDGGEVSLEVVEAPGKEDLDVLLREKITALIDELRGQRGIPWEDIGILVRENKDVELVSEWLMERGFPVASERTLNLRFNPRVKELISLLMFLNSPIDNLAFASFITGEIFSTASGMPQALLRDFIFSLRGHSRAQKHFYFYRAFRESYPGAWETLLEDLFKAVGFVPLYELVISAIAKFRCLEIFPEDQGFFMRLLELIQEEAEDHPSVSLFVELLDKAEGEKLYLKGSGADAIRVMTIHKAKGLDFPIVILPFLEMAVSVDPVVTECGAEGLLLRRVNEKYRKFAPALEAVYAGEFQRAFIDELNNVYVALTRARDSLFIFIPQKLKRSSNLLPVLFGESRVNAGKGSQAVQKKGAAPVYLAASHYENWVRLLQEEFLDRSTLMRRRLVARGEALHYGLSCVGNLWQRDSGAALEDAVTRLRARYPFYEELDACAIALKKILFAEELGPFFSVSDGVVFCEKEVAGIDGSVKRLDRMILKPSEVWIVDYKSSREDEPFAVKQVSMYMEWTREIFASKKIRGFIIYLDILKAQEVS